MTENHGLNVLTNHLEDISRPNLFELEFMVPSLSSSNITIAENAIKTVTLPRIDYASRVISRMGRRITIPKNSGAEITELMIRFHSDINLGAVSFISEWHKLFYLENGTGINNYQNNQVTTDLTSMFGSINLWHLNGNLERIGRYYFDKAWPKSLDGYEYNHDSTDQLQDFTVMFGFMWMHHNKV